MREEYDFSKGIKNPYTEKLKQQITINVSTKVISYFKDMADSTGIPYQTLINMYLCDCVTSGRKLDISWKRGRAPYNENAP